MLPYEILARKRAGSALTVDEIDCVVEGATRGSWSDAELAAFLMAVAIQGADGEETRALTQAMLRSGELWDLAADFPLLADKHSTGGVGDKTSIILTPLLAACGVPVVMLTGRALGHTGGTADKLEAIPGFRQDLDRARAVSLLGQVQAAVGVATASVAPADRRLYALRNRTGTVESIPLITASILSKKLATGAAAIVFDIKTGGGAFLPDRSAGEALARNLVSVARSLGRRAEAVLSDMSQPLGCWAGHSSEIGECLEVLEGGGPADLRELTLVLAERLLTLLKVDLHRSDLEGALADGRARQQFDRWVLAQGAEPSWVRSPVLPRAPVEIVACAPRAGFLSRVDTRGLGFLLAEEANTQEGLDLSVSLRVAARLGEPVAREQELARLYVRPGREAENLVWRLAKCFEIAEQPGEAPTLCRVLEI